MSLLVTVAVLCSGCSVSIDKTSANSAAKPQTEPYLPPAEREIADKWLPLLEQNGELAGWITVPGTTMDYPVMQAGDNSQYLRMNFDQQYSVFGTPFLDCRCSIQPQCRNLVVYGHATRSGELFGQLEAYMDPAYALQNRSIQFATLYEDQTWEIFAVFKTPVSGADIFDYTRCRFEDDAAFLSFVQEAQRRSAVQLDAAIAPGNFILTIQTCAFDPAGQRLVVMAKRTD